MKTLCLMTAVSVICCYCLASCDENNGGPEDAESETSTETVFESNRNTDSTMRQVTEPVTGQTVKGKNISLVGKIAPEKKSPLSIHIEWSASQNENDENAILTFKIFLDCYSIHVAERKDGKLTVNGDIITFKTPSVIRTDNTAASYELTTVIHSVPSGKDDITKISVEASYIFGGVYGGTEIGTLAVSGVITLDPKAKTSAETVNPKKPELPSNAFKPDA